MRTRIQTMRKPKITTVAQGLSSSFSRVVSAFADSPLERQGLRKKNVIDEPREHPAAIP